MRIRRCRDLQLIDRLQKACLPIEPKYPSAPCCWWVAWDGDKPAGFGGYIASALWDKTIYLCRAGVLEPYRGKGLQKRLIKARLRHAKSEGFRWAYTETRQNPASSNSLISCGFKIYEPDAPWSFSDAIYFRRKL